MGVCVATVAAALAGCGPQAAGQGGPPAAGHVDVVVLAATPNALNLDNAPGPDGIRLALTFYQLRRPEPQTVRGNVEVLLFDGKAAKDAVGRLQPLHVWTFTADQLSEGLARNVAGYGYVFTLSWGTAQPRSTMVTVVARYCAPDGAVILSEPVAIAVGRT